MKILSTILMGALLFTSCAHNLPKNNFNKAEVNFEKEGIFFGNIKINYDDSKMSMNECVMNFVDSSKKKITAHVDMNGNFESAGSDGEVYLE
jgi:PBP1b-binding outer membrane lipoprotein LpoB